LIGRSRRFREDVDPEAAAAAAVKRRNGNSAESMERSGQSQNRLAL